MKPQFFYPVVFVALIVSQQLQAETCLVPQEPQRIRCEAGGEFLCVDTPQGGTAQTPLRITGRINEDLGTLGTFALRVQNDYTKKTEEITPENPLDENGIFSIPVPLPELGPYTISVTATPENGPPRKKIVHTSFVTAVSLTEDVIKIEPEAKHFKVSLDLLSGCTDFCDFIGSGTGGVDVLVKGEVTTGAGVIRAVECRTTVNQGGPGRFSVGVPKLTGENRLWVEACNAANKKTGECPRLGPLTFTSEETSGAIVLLEPKEDKTPFFATEQNHSFRLKFKINGVPPPEPCTDQVAVSLNANASEAICPNAEGVYEIMLAPEEGYNLALIQYQNGEDRLQKVYPFGFGKVEPATTPVNEGFNVWLSNDFLNRTMVPLLNHFFSSDGLAAWVREATEGLGRGPKGEKDKEETRLAKKILDELPHCNAEGGGFSHYRFKFVKSPRFEKMELAPVDLTDEKMTLPIDIKKFEASIQFFSDEDGDGIPDEDPLPLKISFRRAKIRPAIEKKIIGNKPYWVFTAPDTDCVYKNDAYCDHAPAVLVPERFVGGATKSGGFVTCDWEQGVSKEMEETCHSVNAFNMQTGLFNEKVLDALNSMFACTLSAELTALAQKGVEQGGVRVFWQNSRTGTEGIQLNTDWIFPETSAPILSQQKKNETDPTKKTKGVSFALETDLLNRLAQNFELTFRYGPDTLKEKKFDFIGECEREQSPLPNGEVPKRAVLCDLLPRVQEILGTPLSEQGTMGPKDPLYMTLKPSKDFPLEIHLVDLPEKEKGINVRLANWDWFVYRVKIDPNQSRDEYGNPHPLLDEKGNAVVEENPLIQVKVGLVVTVKIKGPRVSSEKPDLWLLELTPVTDSFRLFMSPLEETNTTVIPGTNLISNLRDKINSVVSTMAQESQTFTAEFPKVYSLSKPLFGDDSWLARFGLEEITWDPAGFGLELNTAQNRMEGWIDPILKQVLMIDWKPREFVLP